MWCSQFKRIMFWSTGSSSVFSHLIWFRCLKHTMCHILKAGQYLVVFSEGKTNLMKTELMKVGRGKYCRLVLNNLGRWSWVVEGLGWWIILSHPLASPCPLLGSNWMVLKNFSNYSIYALYFSFKNLWQQLAEVFRILMRLDMCSVLVAWRSFCRRTVPVTY